MAVFSPAEQRPAPLAPFQGGKAASGSAGSSHHPWTGDSRNAAAPVSHLRQDSTGPRRTPRLGQVLPGGHQLEKVRVLRPRRSKVSLDILELKGRQDELVLSNGV